MLRLNTLTPATSFNKGSSTGQQGGQDSIFTADAGREPELPCEGRGGDAASECPESCEQIVKELDDERHAPCGYPLRSCCHSRFLKAIKKKRIQSDCPLFEHLGIHRSVSLYDAVFDFVRC